MIRRFIVCSWNDQSPIGGLGDVVATSDVYEESVRLALKYAEREGPKDNLVIYDLDLPNGKFLDEIWDYFRQDELKYTPPPLSP